MDLFEKWLNNKDSKWIEIALTDSSYNNYRKRGIRKNNPRYAEVQKDLPVNKDLALVGDALINFVYSVYLFNKGTYKLTEVKKDYVSDEHFVSHIAKHYDLLNHIMKDDEDKNLPNDYKYDTTQSKSGNSHKYIATCVEAIIGAIYKETNDLESITELLIGWEQFVKRNPTTLEEFLALYSEDNK